jgi:hypothetical protein
VDLDEVSAGRDRPVGQDLSFSHLSIVRTSKWSPLLGAEQAVRLATGPSHADPWTPLYAAGFLLAAELAWWSIEPRVPAFSELPVLVNRLAVIALSCAGGAVLAALVVLAAGAPLQGGVGLELGRGRAAAALAVNRRPAARSVDSAAWRGCFRLSRIEARDRRRQAFRQGDRRALRGRPARAAPLARPPAPGERWSSTTGRPDQHLRDLLEHEAMQAGSVFALDREDWIFPVPRVGNQAAARDAPSTVLVVARPPGQLVEPARLERRSICVPIGTQRATRAGLAWARSYAASACAIAYFGDGATSGAF